MISETDMLSRYPNVSESQATIEPECPFIVRQDMYDNLRVAMCPRESERVRCKKPSDTTLARVRA